jgi:FlaA1/EpsC-like NDP-sugar epimerase
MTIPEAVQLVLQAAVLPDAASRISMLEMGEPVRILYLAEQMIRLSGLIPYKDVPIVFTGLRPGEKLDEELTSNVEATIPTVVEKIRLVNTDEVDGETFSFGLDRMHALLTAGTDQEMRHAMRALVPEYAEFVPRLPFADVEVPIPAAPVVAPKRSPVRPAEMPALGGVASSLETAINPQINVAHAS